MTRRYFPQKTLGISLTIPKSDTLDKAKPFLIYFLHFVLNSMSKPVKRYLFKNSDAGAPSWKRVQKFGLVYVPQLK